jgi:signal transduction histidine kinase
VKVTDIQKPSAIASAATKQLTVFWSSVKMTGIGIPPEKRKDLFIPGVGSTTGFSLFFVDEIFELSDMTIQETGEPGTGVRFEISVPAELCRRDLDDT